MKFHPQVKGINAYTRVIYTPFDNTIKGFYFKEDKSQLVIETFSIETKKIKIKWSVMLMNTGYCSELFDGLFRLVHHANGKVALLSSESIIYIIKGSSEHDAMEVNLEWKSIYKLKTDLVSSVKKGLSDEYLREEIKTFLLTPKDHSFEITDCYTTVYNSRILNRYSSLANLNQGADSAIGKINYFNLLIG